MSETKNRTIYQFCDDLCKGEKYGFALNVHTAQNINIILSHLCVVVDDNMADKVMDSLEKFLLEGEHLEKDPYFGRDVKGWVRYFTICIGSIICCDLEVQSQIQLSKDVADGKAIPMK